MVFWALQVEFGLGSRIVGGAHPTGADGVVDQLDPVALAASVGADFVHPCWERFESPSSLLTVEWIERVRAADLGIICWHEERPEEIAALNALGVEGICSDQPELLMR